MSRLGLRSLPAACVKWRLTTQRRPQSVRLLLNLSSPTARSRWHGNASIVRRLVAVRPTCLLHVQQYNNVVDRKDTSDGKVGRRWLQMSSAVVGADKTSSKAPEPTSSGGGGSDDDDRYLTIPNALCVSRIALAPVLAYFVVAGQYSLALKIFVFAGATDLLDGWIARNVPGQASTVGSALDPLADKCLVAALFFSLTAAAQIPLWLAVLVVARDVCLVVYSMSVRWRTLETPRSWARYWNPAVSTIKVNPTTLSKYNTGLQLLTSACTLLAASCDYSYHPALQALWCLTAISTVASGASYAVSKNTIEYLKTKRRL